MSKDCPGGNEHFALAEVACHRHHSVEPVFGLRQGENEIDGDSVDRNWGLEIGFITS